MKSADPHPNDLIGLDAWLPQPGSPSFVGVDRSGVSVAFTKPYSPEAWHVRARRRIAAWLLKGVAP